MATVRGGPIQAVKIIADGDLQENGGDYVVVGRVAQRVYRFTTEQRAVTAGPVMPCYLVTQAQLDSGVFRLQGNVSAKPIVSVDDLGAVRPVQGAGAVPLFVVDQE